MFSKILIANRGEIACRVIRACKALGIRTVAVYSEADANALHVKMADEAVLIGPAPVVQSYLKVDAVLEAAKQTGAEAIHPGYGLLSENAAFATACAEAGIAFIGPKPEVIAKMGVKTEARVIMQQAGVPVVPGSDGAVADVAEAQALANRFGYPVMLKAAGGGGGIGMQLCHNDEDLEKAFKLCAARAKAYFGNGDLYIEKYVVEPRHIEIQVLADHHGHVVHLNERECSIQRRHQKVVEEAPSPFIDPGLRAMMGEVAVKAAEAIGYTNAGTLEFLVDKDRNFYFLEMNTRLQVEHPVTELITEVDLVQWQIRIAAGEALTLQQEALAPRGHAIEARLYAEDPKTFMPSPGTLSTLEWPEGIRIDAWIEPGTVVSPHYDPMLAKLIAYGNDREEAIATLQAAVAKLKVEGIKTNAPMIEAVLANPRFQAGNFTTDFVATDLMASV
ncbi:acetyl-CoA carboxylase biotin carboxylase subunit [bacterium]|nr:acetyl-CoA carboxylase biotin carboxylase subunit [bacterium]